jgi:hypothetical protein
MILKRRNPTIPFALECVLLFMAVSVFGWGLQAKLSLYHTNPGESASTSYMAKLSTEKSSARKVASVDDQDQDRLIGESRHFAALVFSLLGHDVAPANLSNPEPGPRNPGRYNLHGPDLMHRPPPVLS